MENRQEEINTVVNLINDLCTKFNVALIPLDYKGIKVAGVHDNTNGNKYVLVKGK